MVIDDLISRCVVHPKYLLNDAFAIEALLNDDSTEAMHNGKNVYAISVAGRVDLPATADVHGYGCRAAQSGNDTKRNDRVASGKIFDDAKDRSYYIGFYDISICNIISFENASCEFIVACCPENGERAHCEIRIRAKIDLTKREYRNARLDARIALCQLLDGPSRHVCDCDLEREQELSALDLPTLPQPVANFRRQIIP